MESNGSLFRNKAPKLERIEFSHDAKTLCLQEETLISTRGFEETRISAPAPTPAATVAAPQIALASKPSAKSAAAVSSANRVQAVRPLPMRLEARPLTPAKRKLVEPQVTATEFVQDLFASNFRLLLVASCVLTLIYLGRVGH